MKFLSGEKASLAIRIVSTPVVSVMMHGDSPYFAVDDPLMIILSPFVVKYQMYFDLAIFLLCNFGKGSVECAERFGKSK